MKQKRKDLLTNLSSSFFNLVYSKVVECDSTILEDDLNKILRAVYIFYNNNISKLDFGIKNELKRKLKGNISYECFTDLIKQKNWFYLEDMIN